MQEVGLCLQTADRKNQENTSLRQNVNHAKKVPQDEVLHTLITKFNLGTRRIIKRKWLST